MSINKSQAQEAANQYMLQRNVEAAVGIYQTIVEADPSDLSAISMLGDLYAGAGRTREASDQFSRAAAGYIEGGLTRKAIATLKKIIAVDPANVEAAIKLADMYAQAGLPSEARHNYLQIGEALTRKGRTLEALSVYNKIVDLDPLNTSGRIKLGELYLREGMNDQAYEAFVTAADQLAAGGENRRALNAYKEALAIRPDSVDVLAAARKVMSSLGVSDPDKRTRSSALPSAESVGLTSGSLPIPVTSDLPDASASVDQASQEADSFVVQEISKAEILVAYGQVDQAISMLRGVLREQPNSIDVHVKLKDIYLRTGMMAEAAHECISLERIHDALGESDRARDYAVRASRLTQSLEHPSGDLPEPTRKPMKDVAPRVDPVPAKIVPPQISVTPRVPAPAKIASPQAWAPPRVDPTPAKIALPQTPVAPRVDPPQVKITSPLTSVTPRVEATPAKIASPQTPVTPRVEPTLAKIAPQQTSAPPRQVATRHDTRQAETSRMTIISPVSSDAFPIADATSPVEALTPAGEAELVAATPPETALALRTSPATDERERALPVLFASSVPAKKKRSRLVAAAAFVLLGVSALIGGFAYDAHLDKQYQVLALASPSLSLPEPPPLLVSDEPAPVSEGEPLTVVVTPQAQNAASTQRANSDPEPIKHEPASPPQPSSEPAKAVTPPLSLPPRVAVSPDNRAGTETRTPAGLPAGVPIGASPPPEPPPKLVRQSPGVVLGGAIKRVDPVYPGAARDARQSGTVAVEVMINEQGNVTSARALTGPALLRNAAVAAARAWKFKASTLGGVPVATTTTITFNFKL